MKKLSALLAAIWVSTCGMQEAQPAASDAARSVQDRGSSSDLQPPIGPPGRMARYQIESDTTVRGSVVTNYALSLGPVVQRGEVSCQWIRLEAAKASGEQFRVWLLSASYPPETPEEAQRTVARYILQEGDAAPLEFRDRTSGEAVLPTSGGWRFLWPRAGRQEGRAEASEIFPRRTQYLGQHYKLVQITDASVSPPEARVVQLRPDLLMGLPSNTRQKDETRRYDGSDYERIRFTREDYRQMAGAGFNCMRVDAAQLPWMEDLDVFYWGVGVKDVPYPECLYRSCYLGPALFLDEPGVTTRDYVIRPRFEKEPAFRKAVTPEKVLEAFREHFRHVCEEGAPMSFWKGLKARPDVDLGDMRFAQENLFSWETIVSSAAYQLSQYPRVPAAMVFEPPGRLGTLRTLPELNMTYGCQIPVDDPKNFTSIIYGFLRGAARLTGKGWGTSIYGAVDRADAFWFLTHAFDLGATRFFFWDNAGLACVPYGESLALARSLQAHAENHPPRDLKQLSHAAEVAILLPPGYNLGHVHLGKGSLWGLGELNLERRNRQGVPYRWVMSNFFVEVERCLRLGVAFDLFWDLPDMKLVGYREIVRVIENGKVEVEQDRKRTVLDQVRLPTRPSGNPPGLAVELSVRGESAPFVVHARAIVTEQSAPVYYTLGRDTGGVYRNAAVAWELFGPGEEDYRILQAEELKPRMVRKDSQLEVTMDFSLPRSGTYRLRAVTVDKAGRTTVVWTPISVRE